MRSAMLWDTTVMAQTLVDVTSTTGSEWWSNSILHAVGVRVAAAWRRLVQSGHPSPACMAPAGPGLPGNDTKTPGDRGCSFAVPPHLIGWNARLDAASVGLHP